ncbi:MAG: hypothetical protein ACQGVC_07255 [Myxococcota bacterium]
MRPALPILAIASAFLLFSAATLDDFGLTWDEGVKMYDDASYADVVGRIAPHDPRVLHIPGYFYVADTLRSLYAKAVRDAFAADPVLVHHSFNVLLSTACLVLLHGLTLAVSGSRRLAATAAVALALLPQFVGHSQNNPKDLPAAVVFLAVAWAVVAASRRPGAGRVLGAAALFGVALTTRVSALLLPVILGAWLWLRRRDVLAREVRWIAVGGAASLAFAALCFPALWVHGPGVFAEAARGLDVLRGLDVEVLYLGELHRWTGLPWHFSAVHLLATLPPAHLVLLLAAVPALRDRDEEERGKADAGWLALLWVLALFGADLFAPLHYDGIRHLLAALPAVALLAACGAEWCFAWLERRGRRRTALALAGLAVCATTLELAVMHPYQTAYLNPVARAFAGDRPEEWIEVEYWGAPYKEGSAWLDRHAEPHAVVHFVIGGGQRAGEDVARYYLDRRVVRGGNLRIFQDTGTPQYLIFITRKAWYDEFVRDVRARYEPVFTVERGGATLLEIYSNRAGAG